MCSGLNELKFAASDAKQSGTAISGREKFTLGKSGDGKNDRCRVDPGGGEEEEA